MRGEKSAENNRDTMSSVRQGLGHPTDRPGQIHSVSSFSGPPSKGRHYLRAADQRVDVETLIKLMATRCRMLNSSNRSQGWRTSLAGGDVRGSERSREAPN